MELQLTPASPQSLGSPGSVVTTALFTDAAPASSVDQDLEKSSSAIGIKERYHNIVKSPNDKRNYRGLLLTNRLKVLLASDPTVNWAAAALDVQVGSFSDPDEIPGLAHFCEHMLFLGTEKYPQENEYEKFVSDNGGYSNALTYADRTVYHYDITPDKLKKSLDMFAQFFISPLFTESATSRELNAVDSEHQNNIKCDTWRQQSIIKLLSDDDHVFRKFCTGNKETLETIPKSKGIDVRKELLKFHEKWYSSNVMTLVVIGKESLDDLEAIVAPLFSTIEDKLVTAPSWPIHPFPPELRRQRIYIVPVRDERTLNVDFPIPCLKKYNKYLPLGYIFSLIGHKGPGSLLSALRKRGWCNSLCCGAGASARGFGFLGITVDLTEEGINHIDDIISLLFQVSLCCGAGASARGFGFLGITVDLTEEGINHIDDIISLLFQYIAMLKQKGPQYWFWKEFINIKKVNFRFQEPSEPRNFVEDCTYELQDYPMENVISGYALNSEWKPETITEVLSMLSPDNVIVQIAAKAFEEKCTLTERWYGTKYEYEFIDEETLRKWKEIKPSEELHLPTPNEYIPSSLALETDDDPTCKDTAPTIVKDTKLMRLWYKKDSEFLLPKAWITFELVSPLVYSNPLNANLTELFAQLITDSLEEVAYAASMAGMSYSVTRNPKYGVNITVEGYDEKIHLLVEKVIDHLVSFKADPKRFDIIKENRIRYLKNCGVDQPTELAFNELVLCLYDVKWSTFELLATAQDATVNRLDNFAADFMRNIHIEGLMHGNLSRERALKIANLVEEKLPEDGVPLLAHQLILKRHIELDTGKWYIRQLYTTHHRTSGAFLYYACGVKELRNSMTLSLLLNILQEPCFTTLRTKEQLGYIVHSGAYEGGSLQGLWIAVQSEKHPESLEKRVEALIRSFFEDLQNLSDEELATHKAGLVASILQKPKQISNMALKLWGEITSQEYNFDRARLKAEQLNTITKEDLIKFYKKHFCENSADRTKLSTYVISNAKGGAGAQDTKLAEEHLKEESTQKPKLEPKMITDLLEFKSRRRLCPLLTPFMNIPRKGLEILN